MLLVAYYTRSGRVKKAAEDYAKKNGGELLEIKDLAKHKGIIGFIRGGRDALKKISTPIEPLNVDFSKYDKVVVCSPIWAGSMASPIRTFLRTYGKDFKAVDYIIMRAAKANEYRNVFGEMDGLCGKKHENGISLVQGEKA